MRRGANRSERARARIAWLVVCVLVGGATGGYFGYYLPSHGREQEALRQVETLKRVVERLSSERRIAEAVLVDQQVDPATGRLASTVRFAEYGRDGRRLPERHFRVFGDEIYFDALVIKFQDHYVAAGDALRGKSIYLFRRVFGNQQAPEDGILIDDSQPSTAIPNVYRLDAHPTDYERDLWNNFWYYASNRKEAEQRGVRVLMGEAVYQKMVLNQLYHLRIEADGGINFLPGAVPRDLNTTPK